MYSRSKNAFFGSHLIPVQKHTHAKELSKGDFFTELVMRFIIQLYFPHKTSSR